MSVPATAPRPPLLTGASRKSIPFSFSSFPSRRVLDGELSKIYFLPVITDITSIGEDHAVLHADVETSSGPRHLEVRQIRTNIRLLSKNRALIQDVEGNRYELRDYAKLPKLTREILGL